MKEETSARIPKRRVGSRSTKPDALFGSWKESALRSSILQSRWHHGHARVITLANQITAEFAYVITIQIIRVTWVTLDHVFFLTSMSRKHLSIAGIWATITVVDCKIDLSNRFPKRRDVKEKRMKTKKIIANTTLSVSQCGIRLNN